MENNQSSAVKSNIVKIVVPLLIIIVAIAIWFFKNGGNSEANHLAGEDNSDFALAATSDLDLDALKEYGLPILLDFGAEWCPPCKAMEPTMIKLNGELRDKVIIKYIDIDKMPEFVADYPVTVVPTQFLFNADGTPFVPSDDIALTFLKYQTYQPTTHVLTAHEGALSEEELLLLFHEMGMVND